MRSPPTSPLGRSAPRARQDPSRQDTDHGTVPGYESPAGSGSVVALHRLPEKVSAKGLTPSLVTSLPTATQVVAEVHDTPDSEASDPPLGTAAVDAAHVA